MYNYLESIKEDIKSYAITDEIKTQIRNGERDEVEQTLYDDLFCDDSITGNASGSYWCNAYKAFECIGGNESLIEDVVREFCMEAESVAHHITDWEYWDVSIRCYLLGQAISEVLNEIENEEA